MIFNLIYLNVVFPKDQSLVRFFSYILNDVCNVPNIHDVILFSDHTNVFLSLIMNTINSGLLKLIEW